MIEFYQKIYFGREIYGSQEKIAKINQEIYSSRESSDSPGSFGFERARKINSRVISKNSKTICD